MSRGSLEHRFRLGCRAFIGIVVIGVLATAQGAGHKTRLILRFVARMDRTVRSPVSARWGLIALACAALVALPACGGNGGEQRRGITVTAGDIL